VQKLRLTTRRVAREPSTVDLPRSAATTSAAEWPGRPEPGWPRQIALIAIAAGGQHGHLAITAAISRLYPAVPLTCGLLSRHGHLTLHQILGIATVMAGVALINIA
jgi:hypothetical protein